MELGCDGVLMNTAIAGAKDPVRMARAMGLAVEAGAKRFWQDVCRASLLHRHPHRWQGASSDGNDHPAAPMRAGVCRP
jgi:thiazole synthase ThiGH ThiG subunit